jgi:hypothetical protein
MGGFCEFRSISRAVWRLRVGVLTSITSGTFSSDMPAAAPPPYADGVRSECDQGLQVQY